VDSWAKQLEKSGGKKKGQGGGLGTNLIYVRGNKKNQKSLVRGITEPPDPAALAFNQGEKALNVRGAGKASLPLREEKQGRDIGLFKRRSW